MFFYDTSAKSVHPLAESPHMHHKSNRTHDAPGNPYYGQRYLAITVTKS